MRVAVVAVAIMVAGCNAAIGVPELDAGEQLDQAAAPAIADLGELACAWRDGWTCYSGTRDCTGPDGVRRVAWEQPIYCCAGVLVAPAFGADLAGGACR